jgi:Ser/Thr protein kinase RdoA (MazF antagonist)
VLLNVDNVIPYLIERGHLDTAAVVDGDVRVVSASRRNRNFRVLREGGPSLLLKQAESAGHNATLTSEAEFYRACWSNERAQAVRPLLPRLVGTQAEDALLIIELLKDAVPVSQCQALFTTQGFLAAFGQSLGMALGLCHRTFRDEASRPGRVSRHPPWVLWAHRPGPEIFAELSPANMRTLQILQGDAVLSRHLDALRKGWQAETLIHCDIKSDNLLLARPFTEGSTEVELRVVDWELVQLGDPAWDVAAVFKDLLASWIYSMPISAGMSGTEMAARASYPLALFQAAWGSLWRGYCATTGLDERSAEALLGRAVRYSAAWLVQSAYEAAYRAPSLGNYEVMMLQVSANIFSDPKGAALHLLGLPLR